MSPGVCPELPGVVDKEALLETARKHTWAPVYCRSFTEQLQHTPKQGHTPVYLGNGSQPAALATHAPQKHAEPSTAALPGEWSDKVNW